MKTFTDESMTRMLILIPAYNEEKRIPSVIEKIRGYFPEPEVLVVNDGSTDGTREEALRSGARVISHPFNLGYGTALQTGYRYALAKGCDRLIQMDGDGQHDPACIADLIAPIAKGEADIVIGSRFREKEGGGSDSASYRAPFIRRLGMRFFSAVTCLIIGQKVTDSTSGYQAVNRKVLEWVSSDRFPCDYPDADVIIMLHRAGFRIREVPVRMFENRDKKSMHSGWKPLYYVFKMCLSILVTLMRK